MSIEEAVRRKHAFEHTLKDYLQFVSAMSREEIELSLGRLADNGQLISEKGAILKIYLDLRNAGIKRQNKVKRVSLRPAMMRFFAERGKAAHANALQRYSAACRQHEAEVWKEKIGWNNRASFWKQTFYKPTLPAAPTLPATVGQYVKQSKAKADMSEYLITSAVNFHHLSVPQRVGDVEREDVKQLAP